MQDFLDFNICGNVSDFVCKMYNVLDQSDILKYSDSTLSKIHWFDSGTVYFGYMILCFLM